jgi:hypothetical protein
MAIGNKHFSMVARFHPEFVFNVLSKEPAP